MQAVSCAWIPRDDVSALRREGTPRRPFLGRDCDNLRGAAVRTPRLPRSVCCCLLRHRGGVRPRHHRATGYRPGRTGVCRLAALAGWGAARRGVCRQLPSHRGFHELRLSRRRRCESSCSVRCRKLSQHSDRARWIFPGRGRDRSDHRYAGIGRRLHPRADATGRCRSRCSGRGLRKSGRPVCRSPADRDQPGVWRQGDRLVCRR